MKKKFEQPEPKAALDGAFSQVLGQPVVIKFLTEDVISNAASNSSKTSSGETDDTEALLKMVTEELGGEISE